MYEAQNAGSIDQICSNLALNTGYIVFSWVNESAPSTSHCTGEIRERQGQSGVEFRMGIPFLTEAQGG